MIGREELTSPECDLFCVEGGRETSVNPRTLQHSAVGRGRAGRHEAAQHRIDRAARTGLTYLLTYYSLLAPARRHGYQSTVTVNTPRSCAAGATWRIRLNDQGVRLGCTS